MSVANKTLEAMTLPAGTTIITGENVVYLMGLSFIIGSLFTIFILIFLDFMRRDQVSK